MSPNSFQIRELFHLAFLRLLALRLTRRDYAVKGGICLRFFHRSQRLSEDMDFDVAGIPVRTLTNHLMRILSERNLRKGSSISIGFCHSEDTDFI